MTRLELLEGLLEGAGEGVRMAEIGVHVGDFAAELLTLEPAELHLVDAWRFIPGEYERDPMNRRGRDFPRFEKRVRKRFRGREEVHVHRKLSAEAAGAFPDEYFDLVYIDADHTRPGIEADLELWWPKVRSGGVLAGHDYSKARPWIDVQEVVDEWVEREGLELFVSKGDAHPSWAVVKP